MYEAREILGRAKPHLAGAASGLIALLAVYFTIGSAFTQSEQQLREIVMPGTVIEAADGPFSPALAKISADKALSGGEKILAIYEYREICDNDKIVKNLISTNDLALASRDDDRFIVGKIYDLENIQLLCEAAKESNEKYVISNHDLSILDEGRLLKLERADVGIKLRDDGLATLTR